MVKQRYVPGPIKKRQSFRCQDNVERDLEANKPSSSMLLPVGTLKRRPVLSQHLSCLPYRLDTFPYSSLLLSDVRCYYTAVSKTGPRIKHEHTSIPILSRSLSLQEPSRSTTASLVPCSPSMFQPLILKSPATVSLYLRHRARHPYSHSSSPPAEKSSVQSPPSYPRVPISSAPEKQACPPAWLLL